MGFLSAIPWRAAGVIGTIVLISVLWFRGNWYRDENALNAAALGQALDINEANARAFDRYRQQINEMRAKEAEASKKKAAIRRSGEQKKEKIREAPATDDGPLAPVLRDTLNSLRPPPGGDGGTRI